MIRGFAQIGIAARDIAGASEAWRRVLGFDARDDGAHTQFLLQNIALEITEAEAGTAEGRLEVAFAVDDLAEACRTLTRRGAPCGDVSGDPPSAVISVEASAGVPVRLIEAQRPGEKEPAPDSLSALDHMVIRTPNPDRAMAFYGARLGLDLRLDRSNPAWGSRLLFFRCGDAVVEVSADLATPASDTPDILSGLAWRARDPDAARARLATAGLDVSEVRDGRKPGTRVFTIRSGVLGAPALVIGPGAGDS